MESGQEHRRCFGVFLWVAVNDRDPATAAGYGCVLFVQNLMSEAFGAAKGLPHQRDRFDSRTVVLDETMGGFLFLSKR